MSFEDFERVDDIFRRALELPPEQRESFVNEQCAQEHDLRDQVLGLLRTAQESGPLSPGGALAHLDQGFGTRPLAEPKPGDELGAYQLIRRIGEGGMAVVFLARRSDGVYRGSVAIKFLKTDLTRRGFEQRFQRERQILSQLRHPNIAQMLDGGSTQDGRPYLVLEYVDGLTLTRYCDEQRMTIDERLQLMITVCRAVQFAHRNLVVHRDLKPANILVTEGGLPKLLDFGIARLLQPDGLAAPSDLDITAAGLTPRVLTPLYASPEQVLGEPVSTTTDVHALGLLLFEVLSGRPARRISSSKLRDIEDAVCGELRSVPSAAVAQNPEDASDGLRPEQVAANRSSTPKQLIRRLQGDLDTIVQKATRPEPEERYETAGELAADLQRHLEALPITARPTTFAYRAGKFLRRRKGLVAAACLVIVSILLGMVATLIQAGRTAQEAERAQQVVELLTSLLEDADPNRSRGDDVTVREVFDQAASSLPQSLDTAPLVRASLQEVIGKVYLQLGAPGPAADQLQQARTLLQQHAPSTDRLAAVERSLASALSALSRFEEAERSARSSLEARGNATAISRAQSLTTLASVLNDAGDVEASRAAISDALALLDEERPIPREALADTYQTAAQVEYQRGNLAGAEERARREVALRREMGIQNRALAYSEYTLANILMRRGHARQLEESISLFEEAHQREMQLLGEDHPWTIQILAMTASARSRFGDFEGGENAYLLALENTASALGVESEPYVDLLNNLAVFYHRQQRWPEAIQRYSQSISVGERVLSPSHPTVANTRSYLALALDLSGSGEAESAYQGALEALLEARGADHEKTGNLRSDLGVFLLRQERYAEAEPHLREGLRISSGIFDPAVDYRVDKPRLALAWLFCRSGRAPDAEPLLAASQARRRDGLTGRPTPSWELLELDLVEAGCALASGQRSRAIVLVRQVAARWQQEGRARTLGEAALATLRDELNLL